MTKLKRAIFEAALREKEGYRQAVDNNRLEDAMQFRRNYSMIVDIIFAGGESKNFMKYEEEHENDN